jgi:hypothetical protein
VNWRRESGRFRIVISVVVSVELRRGKPFKRSLANEERGVLSG